MTGTLIIFIMGIIFILCGYHMTTNKYHFLPAGKKPEDYEKVIATIEEIYKIRRTAKDSNGDFSDYIEYKPVINFWDRNNSECIRAEVNHSFRKNNMFQTGQKIEIFYKKRPINVSERLTTLIDKHNSLNGINIDNLSYNYEVYFSDPDIYNNEYPKWNKIALFLLGIGCFIMGFLMIRQ